MPEPLSFLSEKHTRTQHRKSLEALSANVFARIHDTVVLAPLFGQRQRGGRTPQRCNDLYDGAGRGIGALDHAEDPPYGSLILSWSKLHDVLGVSGPSAQSLSLTDVTSP